VCYFCRMKKLIISSLLVFFTGASIFAQEKESSSKGILKFDVYNLLGLGVQKIHFGYEIMPFEPNENSLPTIQFDAYIPLTTWSEFVTFKPSLEVGVQLRFYQGKNLNRYNPSGFYMGAGIDGGYTRFHRMETFVLENRDDIVRRTDYDRIRTGIYGMIGAQSKIGKNFYFDVSFGMGWSNNFVDPQQADPSFYKLYTTFVDNEVFYSSYRRGRYPSFYVPLNASVGFRF
jgi:hypothetical protein